jgi:hypothetical protein
VIGSGLEAKTHDGSRRPMPTTPPSHLLDRDLTRAALQKHIEVADPLLYEVVNYGVALLTRCRDELKGGAHHLGILLPLHHLLEMIDAVHIQLIAGAPAPARLQLRSAFEAVLTIEYILKDDTERRAFAYLTAWAQTQMAKYRAVKKHIHLGAKAEEIDERIAVLQGQVGHPGWMEASAALKDLKRMKGRRPPWYGLYGGPSNLAELAEDVGHLDEYDVLYREWSGPTHACDLGRQVITRPGTITFRRLRAPEEFNGVLSYAVNFAVRGSRMVLLYYRPGEERAWKEWYNREVRGSYARF